MFDIRNIEHMFDGIRAALPWLDIQQHPIIGVLLLFAAPCLLAIVAQLLMRQLHNKPARTSPSGARNRRAKR